MAKKRKKAKRKAKRKTTARKPIGKMKLRVEKKSAVSRGQYKWAVYLKANGRSMFAGYVMARTKTIATGKAKVLARKKTNF